MGILMFEIMYMNIALWIVRSNYFNCLKMELNYKIVCALYLLPSFDMFVFKCVMRAQNNVYDQIHLHVPVPTHIIDNSEWQMALSKFILYICNW